MDDYSYFSQWFLPQSWLTDTMDLVKTFDSNAFNSFPSGHTSAASVIFAVIIIPDLFDKLNTSKIRWMFYVVPAIYVAVVAFSRVVVGAHFLSDVTFGAYVAFGYAVLFRHLALLIKRKIEAKSSQINQKETSDDD